MEDADARRVADVPARTSRSFTVSIACNAEALCDVGDSGDTMQPAHRKHYAKFRLRCVKDRCGMVFCGGCRAQPYHEGYTCDEWKRREDGLSCRCARCRCCFSVAYFSFVGVSSAIYHCVTCIYARAHVDSSGNAGSVTPKFGATFQNSGGGLCVPAPIANGTQRRAVRHHCLAGMPAAGP
jgi:hypothetical protein